jgi:proline dehydrogenase
VVYLGKNSDNLIGKLVFRLVRKHIAGSTSSAVLNVVREINNKGMHTTVTLLNDHVDDPTKARYNTNAYIQFIKQLSRLQLNSDISVRPSQLGATIDEGLLERNMQDIIDAANSYKQRLWIEEESDSTYDSMGLYRKFRPKCSTLGVEIRPELEEGGNPPISRLVSSKDTIKLRYHTPAKQKAGVKGVDRSKLYKGYIEALLGKRVNLTVLEHDQNLIRSIVASGKDYKRNLIFEIPLGYDNKLSKLVKGKLNMSVYVPYGKDWIPYFINRLAEGRIRNIAVKLLDGEKSGAIQGVKK